MTASRRRSLPPRTPRGGTVRSSATASVSGTSSILRAPQRGHRAPVAARRAASMAATPEARGQHAVEGGRGAAALRVAEHGGARLVAGAALDLAPRGAVRCRRGARGRTRPRRALITSMVPLGGIGALGHHHDREVAPARVPAPDQPADLVDVERPLGDRGSRRRRRRAPSAARSSPRGGPSPRPPSPGCGSRRWCGAGRWPRWPRARRCRSRTSCRCRRGRCRSSSARRAPAGRARRAAARPRRACPRRRSRSGRRGRSARRFSRIRLGAAVARERVGARGAEDGAAARQDAARGLDRSAPRRRSRAARASRRGNPTISCPWRSIPLRTIARITAFRPGQSPPPVSTPTRTPATLAKRA